MKIDLDRAIDHLSLVHRIRIKDARGKTVRGRLWLEDKEETWLFSPDICWAPGTYTIVIDQMLEDIRGNRIDERFDQPLEETYAKPQFLLVKFEILDSPKDSLDE